MCGMNKLKSRCFVRPVCLYIIFLHFILLYPYNFIKDKPVDLIENVFQREGSLYIAGNDRHAFFTSNRVINLIYCLVRKCVKLSPFS